MFGDDNSKPLLLPIVYDLANLIREGFLRSDKYKEHEKQNHHQFLRRSFNTAPQKSGTIKEIDFSAPVNYYNNDAFMVDDTEPIVKNNRDENESIDDIKPEQLIQILNKNFTTTTASIPATLFRSEPSITTTTSRYVNMTMEEIESMALSSLNGTVKESIKDVNGSEILPMALISRNRKRPSNQNQQLRGGPVPETCERFTGEYNH